MSVIESLKILQSESTITKFLPYSHHVSDSVISTKTGEYISVWKIEGRSHQSASTEEHFQWVEELNNVLKGIGTANVSLWSHVVRRRVDDYPDSNFENAFAKQLDDKYRDSFKNIKLMVNDLYLTVVYKSMSDKVLSFFAKHEKKTQEQKILHQQDSIAALDEINRSLKAAFQKYGGELLTTYDNNGYVFSAPLEFLSKLVNGEQQKMPVCRDRFSEYMATNRVFFAKHGEVGEVKTTTGLRRFGILEIFEYPTSTEPGHLNALLESNFEFILTQSFACLSRHAAKDAVEKQKRNLIDSNDVGTDQIDDINYALNDLISSRFVMGEHHATLTVFGDSVDDVRDYLALAKNDLSDVGIMTTKCDLALEAAYWAMLPGNWKYRPRPNKITSLNFLSFSPFHNFLSGKPNGNPWGAAVTILKTVSGTPLYFNFHSSKIDEDAEGKRYLGNTMFIGKSGTGKSVTMGFTLSQSMKLDPTVVIFDKDQGLQTLVLQLGGRYLPLRNGERSGFNPFALEPTPANLSFLKRLIKVLATSNGDLFTHQDEKEIDIALDTVMNKLDRESRRLSILVQSLPNPISDDPEARPTLHARLLKYCQGGELGWLFDNPEDLLDLSTHKVYGFDVTDFLENPEVRAPLMMYLLYRTEGMIDGRRFIYMFDEFQQPLKDEYMQDLAQNKNRVIRKQNGIFVYATQEPGAILDSPIARTLVQQCATMVFLPNPQAERNEYVNGFKLTHTEFEIVRGLGESSRRFLVKQGENSAVAELNLAGFDDELLVMSGTPDNAEIAEQCIAELGDNPELWLQTYLDRVRGLEN